MAISDPAGDILVNGDEGDNITFSCTANGVPEPSITWSPPTGDRIETTSSPPMTDMDGFISVTSTLTISMMERTDTGDYTCIASNTVQESVVMMNRTHSLSVLCEYTNKFSNPSCL